MGSGFEGFKDGRAYLMKGTATSMIRRVEEEFFRYVNGALRGMHTAPMEPGREPTLAYLTTEPAEDIVRLDAKLEGGSDGRFVLDGKGRTAEVYFVTGDEHDIKQRGASRGNGGPETALYSGKEAVILPCRSPYSAMDHFRSRPRYVAVGPGVVETLADWMTPPNLRKFVGGLRSFIMNNNTAFLATINPRAFQEVDFHRLMTAARLEPIESL